MDAIFAHIREASEAAAASDTGSYANAPDAARKAWETFIHLFTEHGVPTGVLDREALGRLVREVWVAFARTLPETKESWLRPWDDLPEPQKEVDRRIGETLGVYTLAMAMALPRYLSDAEWKHLRTVFMAARAAPAPKET